MKNKNFIPLQYESYFIDSDNYSESGVETGAKLDLTQIDNPDVVSFCKETNGLPLRQKLIWVQQHESELSDTTFLVGPTISDDRKMEVAFRKHRGLKMVLLSRSLHTTYKVDRCLSIANEHMEMGGYLFCHTRTSALKKQFIVNKYPLKLGHIAYAFHFFWHRMCPKMKYTKNLYFSITGGTNRSFSRVEVLGRLYHAGFDVVHESFVNGEFFVVCRKFRSPIYGDSPSVSPIIKLNRVGKHGKVIGVYKFRTMYSYSEYLQPYIYRYQHLDTGGKFANDYRVNELGRFLRATWLDEFPMILNLLKGQMKLVGVRPLSKHYFSLYSPEMQQLRTRTKPGLLPPFYYEDSTPETLDEIQASERRYLEAYLKHPLLTDWRYFWGIVYNIVSKRLKSK